MNDTNSNEEASQQWPVLSDELRQRIEATWYGTDAGWIAELDDQPIASLTYCWHGYPDMFWDAYKLIPLTKDEAVLSKLRTWAFWNQQRIVFRNKEFSDMTVASDHVIISVSEESGAWEDSHQIATRYLRLDIDPPKREAFLAPPVEPTDTWSRIRGWLRKIF